MRNSFTPFLLRIYAIQRDDTAVISIFLLADDDDKTTAGLALDF